MTPENIKQLKEDFDNFEKARSKRSKIDSVTKHIGAVGRNHEIGKWQNQYDCKIQVALQYAEGRQNYWHADELNKEFAKTINANFNRLLDETIQRVNLDYQNAQSAFDKYRIKETKQ